MQDVGGARAAHLAIPTAADIEALLLQKKKKILLQQYASEAQLSQEDQARQMLGRA